MRNLDEILEAEPSRPSKIATLVLASVGGACIVFAAIALVRSPSGERPVPSDPLGDLVARSKTSAPAPAGGAARIDLSRSEVTFPGVLSDDPSPTTALAALGAKHDPSLPDAVGFRQVAGPGGASGPPPASDRLPVVTLPASDMLNTSPVVTRARDPLTSMAVQASRESTEETATAGGGGGYQLQVSSFKDEAEAEAFAAMLRRRGHRAYREAADVRGRGIWHRVKIGPFKTKNLAAKYREDFEVKERIVTFVVDPPKPNGISISAAE